MGHPRQSAQSLIALCSVRSQPLGSNRQGAVSFGYSGVARRTLFNAFRRATYRPRSITEIFSNARRSVEVLRGTNMEEAFLDVVGSEQRPLVRLQPRFHVRLGIDQTYPIYVFWDTSVLNRPDWSLSRVTDPIGLDKLASSLERSLQDYVRSARRVESLATATAETPEQGNEVLAQAPTGFARGDDIGSSVFGSEPDVKHEIPTMSRHRSSQETLHSACPKLHTR